MTTDALSLLHLHYLHLDDDLGSEDWKYLLRQQLLTSEEIATAMSRPEPIVAIYLWAYSCVRLAFKDPQVKEQGPLNAPQLNLILSKLENLQRHAAQQNGYQRTSVPIHYFHRKCHGTLFRDSSD